MTNINFDSVVLSYDTSDSRSLTLKLHNTYLTDSFQPFPNTLSTVAFDDSTCRRFGTSTFSTDSEGPSPIIYKA